MRRAGKSPPGGASRAEPRRASSGPSSSTDPRSWPTSAASGRSLVTVAQRMRSVDVPTPSTVAPSPDQQIGQDLDVADARHVRQHAFLVREQAGGEQRQRRVLVAFDRDAARQPAAAFDPQCCHVVSTPDQRSIESQVDDLFAQLHAERFANAVLAALDERANVGAVAPPSLTMKLPCVGETRAALRGRPSARRDRRARRPTTECRPAPDRAPGRGSGRCSRRSATRAAACACGTPATPARPRAAPPDRPAGR